MAKALTLADLNNALNPIKESLNRLKEELTTYSTQVTEMHAMVTNISVKMDTLEQQTGATLSEVTKPVVKKTTTRKPPAPRKPPTKRGTKATDEPIEDPAEEEPAEEEPSEPETPVSKKATIKVMPKVAKPPVKKAAPSRLNKMTLFKEVHKTNPAKFDKYLTAKVKKAIDVANSEKWKEYTPEQLGGAQRTEYYHYMKDNHDEVLEALKVEYAENAQEE